MLALLLTLFSSISVKAQTNSEYQFVQHEVPDTYTVGISDTIVPLSMDCLAANGYGQWTASNLAPSPVGTPSSWPSDGWYLLGNRIGKSFNSGTDEKIFMRPAHLPGAAPTSRATA